MAEQLTFDLPIRTALEREDFLVSPANQHAVDFVDLWPDWPNAVACLVGPSGSGKTHLAHVWQKRSHARALNASDLRPEIAASIASKEALILEEADRGLDEEALFHLFNAVTREGAFLLLTGKSPPASWDHNLPDLKSRLATASVIEMQLPDDSLLASLFVKQFADRQIKVDPDVITYLIPRIERSFTALDDVVNRLDKAALKEKAKITTAFARRVLKDD